MQQVIFVTGNMVKFQSGVKICQRYGIKLHQVALDIPEIQAHDGETVARDKALRAYESLKQPLTITDDSWLIPGLNGFPGPFMKFVNQSFTTEDWLRLTAPLQDRRIVLRQIIVYQNADQQQLFYTDVEGVLLTSIHGQGEYPHTRIASFDGGKTSIAETIALHGSATASSGQTTSWDSFCEWYKAQK